MITPASQQARLPITARWALLLTFAVALSSGHIASAQIPDALQRLTVEAIEIEGNDKTRDQVILRNLQIRPGAAISPELIAADQRRLSQTHFFKSVDFYTRPGSEKGKLIVVIEIEERRRPYFQFEGGHSDLSGWYFVPASLRFDNLAGRGNLFGARWLIGDRISQLIFNYRVANLFDDNAYLDIEIFGANNEFVHYFAADEATQNVSHGGLRLKTGGRRGLLKHIYIGYRADTFEPESFATFTETDSSFSALPAEIADDLPKAKVHAVSVGLVTDSRDNLTYPMRGIWGAASLELANREFGSEVDFSKITLDARLYQRLFGRQVFAFHLKGGFTETAAPFYERFYLGGANSLRGYRSRRLTPVGWGSKLILTHTELRFPISQRSFPNHKVTGVLFFDFGGIWTAGSDPSLADFRKSAGFGIRARLPVFGLTRFDFSFPIDHVDQNDFQFHVSLGHTF